VLPQQISAFRQAGMNDHVGKPFRRDDLHAVVARWAAERPAQESAQRSAKRPAVTPTFSQEESSRMPTLDQQTYGGLVAVMGRERVLRLLEQLMAKLEEWVSDAHATPEERQQLAREAHAMVSSAGMLGFAALSTSCADLERACEEGAAVAEVLSRVQAARAEALAEIAALRQAA
jgi:HPt (histidine-containing phosphotransfer) domain-containing protein